MAKVGRPKGLPKTGGRVKGQPNKATADVKAMAQKHGQEAIAEAVRIMQNSESDQARMAAIREILDRAYGKAPQAVVGSEDEAPIKTVLEVVWQGISGQNDAKS